VRIGDRRGDLQAPGPQYDLLNPNFLPVIFTMLCAPFEFKKALNTGFKRSIGRKDIASSAAPLHLTAEKTESFLQSL
jgi:hypothetical protein